MTFGPVIGPEQVENFLKSYVSAWWREYMAAYERANGYDPRRFEEPWNFQTSSEFTHWRGENLPHVVIVSPGLADEPKREAEQVNHCWAMTITVVVTGADRGDVRQNQMAWATIVPWMVEHYPSLRVDSVRAARHLATRFTDIPVEDEGSYGAAAMDFEIEVDGVYNREGSPPLSAPRADPYVPDEDEPVVQTTGKIITPVERNS